jgi:hypothetical protein
MKDILKFVVLFLMSYGILIYLCNQKLAQSLINDNFRHTVEYFIKATLPNAYIETQNYVDANGITDHNLFHVVYGNPEVIHAEKEFATKQGLKEYKISTYSFQVYIFHMLIVPLVFLLSIFLATPMPWRSKLKSITISLLLLLALIIGRCILITLFEIANIKIGIYMLNDSSLYLCFKLVSMLTLGFSIMFVFFLWLLFGLKNSLFASQFSNFIKSFQK